MLPKNVEEGFSAPSKVKIPLYVHTPSFGQFVKDCFSTCSPQGAPPLNEISQTLSAKSLTWIAMTA